LCFSSTLTPAPVIYTLSLHDALPIYERLDLCGMADFPGDPGGRDLPRRRELRAGSGDRGDQLRPREPRRDRRTAGTQCALCFDRSEERRVGKECRSWVSAEGYEREHS